MLWADLGANGDFAVRPPLHTAAELAIHRVYRAADTDGEGDQLGCRSVAGFARGGVVGELCEWAQLPAKTSSRPGAVSTRLLHA